MLFVYKTCVIAKYLNYGICKHNMAFLNTIESLGEEWQTIDGLPQPTYDSREEFAMCYARYILLVHSQKAIDDIMCGLNHYGVSQLL